MPPAGDAGGRPRQPFDRRHGPSVVVDGQGETGEHGLAVDEHGACAALAELAAVLRAGELQVLAQHFEQRFSSVDERLGPLAVHGERQASPADPGIDGHIRPFMSFTSFMSLMSLRPRTRNAATVSATSSTDAGPSGRNQVTVQLSAPSMARVTMAGAVD